MVLGLPSLKICMLPKPGLIGEMKISASSLTNLVTVLESYTSGKSSIGFALELVHIPHSRIQLVPELSYSIAFPILSFDSQRRLFVGIQGRFIDRLERNSSVRRWLTVSIFIEHQENVFSALLEPHHKEKVLKMLHDIKYYEPVRNNVFKPVELIIPERSNYFSRFLQWSPAWSYWRKYTKVSKKTVEQERVNILDFVLRGFQTWIRTSMERWQRLCPNKAKSNTNTHILSSITDKYFPCSSTLEIHVPFFRRLRCYIPQPHNVHRGSYVCLGG